MEKEKKKYNAFISYRHTDLDKFVAENLHRLIETYKMPKPVVEKYNITDNDNRRIFRDQDELPLSPSLEDPIIEALKNSEFLIVICSPRLKESLWCKKEVENFIKFHGRNKILCVLVEGEPKDSFPEEVLYYEEETKNELGETVTKKVDCEPLAMDVRGANKKEVLKKLKSEIVRIMAPLYKLDYDDIKRRHEERELKRKAKIFKIIAIASLIFAIYSLVLFSRIYISSKQLKYDQSVTLADSAMDLLLKDDRTGAVETSYQSVTKYNNIKMPVTARGRYVLTQSLGLYYPNNNNYNAVSGLNTLGLVRHIKTDADGEYLLSYDDSDQIVLWDLKNETKIKTVSDPLGWYAAEKMFTFIGKTSYAYINNNSEIVIIDLKGNEITRIKSKSYPNSINASKNGKYLEVAGDDISVYETDTYTLVADYKIPSDMKIIDKQYFDDKEENLVFGTIEKDAADDFNELILSTYNIKQKNIINTTTIDSHSVEKILFKDENAIVLSNRKSGTLSGDMVITSYNYKTGKQYYQKFYYGSIGKDIEMSSSDKGETTLLVVDYISAKLLDFKTGDKKSENARGAGAVYIQDTIESYRVFTQDGNVIWIKNSDDMHSIQPNLAGYFNFSLSNYNQFLYTSRGYIGYSTSDNRIIIYGHLKNDDIQETEYEEKEFNKIDNDEKDSIIEEYNFENKDLISKLFYSEDKQLLFVTYKYGALEIYNNKTKKLLKTIENISKEVDTYVCKTEDGEHIIKSSSAGYILNKDFELITYVPALYDYYNGIIILKDGKKYYEVKKYSEKEIINKGNEYLKSRGRLQN